MKAPPPRRGGADPVGSETSFLVTPISPKIYPPHEVLVRAIFYLYIYYFVLEPLAHHHRRRRPIYEYGHMFTSYHPNPPSSHQPNQRSIYQRPRLYLGRVYICLYVQVILLLYIVVTLVVYYNNVRAWFYHKRFSKLVFLLLCT